MLGQATIEEKYKDTMKDIKKKKLLVLAISDDFRILFIKEIYTIANCLCLKRKIPLMPNQLPYFPLYMEVSKVESCLPLKTGSILLEDTSSVPSLKAKCISAKPHNPF
jgi:hypothetical protein